MKTKNVSPYSKMYLIPPNMYEKLLACLADTEKRQMEELNIDKDILPEKPGEKQIEILTKEALETEQQPPIEEMEPIENVLPLEQEMQVEQQPYIEPPEPEVIPEDIPLSEVQRKQKLGQLQGRIQFNEPGERLFTCQVCLKSFKRAWDLLRHNRTVHKNLQVQNVPAMLNVSQSQPVNLPENIQMERDIPRKQTFVPPSQQDIEMIRSIPTIQTQPCPISSETTTRVIPELYFKPPREQIIVPQIKKYMKLVPSIAKAVPSVAKAVSQGRITKPQKKQVDISEKKKQLLVPAFSKKKPLKVQFSEPKAETFVDWGEGPKKKGTRTASEAKLKMQPSKYVKSQEFETW